jgi:hypothetical protein
MKTFFVWLATRAMWIVVGFLSVSGLFFAAGISPDLGLRAAILCQLPLAALLIFLLVQHRQILLGALRKIVKFLIPPLQFTAIIQAIGIFSCLGAAGLERLLWSFW